ncbi:hypothetical protein EBR43_04200 [bacterium]|nr:hypothetical protein [bacterium]
MNTIYWSVVDKDLSIIDFEPLQNIKDLSKEMNFHQKRSNFNLCPAYYLEAQKTYNILAPFDYELVFDSETKTVSSKKYNQNVFDKMITVEDIDLGFVQFNIGYIFFTEQPCNMFSTAPYFTHSEFSSRVNFIPGSVDISRWFRNTSVAFMLKNQYNSIEFKKGDPLLSFKFDFFNNEKIEFKKFYISHVLTHILDTNMNSRLFNDKNLNTYLKKVYDKFTQSKIKTTILKEIKANLME